MGLCSPTLDVPYQYVTGLLQSTQSNLHTCLPQVAKFDLLTWSNKISVVVVLDWRFWIQPDYGFGKVQHSPAS